MDSYMARVEAVEKNKESEEKRKKIVEYLKEQGMLEEVNLVEEYVYPSGRVKKNLGFFLDNDLKHNLDNYLIRAVEKKWDGIFLMTGLEGSGKTTMGAAVCKYLDPTFPGEPLNDGTPRRHCERIVFTAQQFSEAVAKSKPKQAIQFDEAILALMAGDAGTNIQKMLMKEITLIRKKQLYIVLVIPSIFSMRMPIAVHRSRFLIHTYSPDGIERGYFKFYNYPTKRQLYIKGKRDYNQDAVFHNFHGSFVDTEGLFYDIHEYDRKKEAAIASISNTGSFGKNIGMADYKVSGQRNLLLYYLYNLLGDADKGKVQLEKLVELHNAFTTASNFREKLSVNKFAEWLKQVFGEHMSVSAAVLNDYLKNAVEYASKPIKPLETKKKIAFGEASSADELADEELDNIESED